MSTLKNFTVLSNNVITCIIGENEKNLEIISREFNVNISSKGNDIFISGNKEDVDNAYIVLKQLEAVCDGSSVLSNVDIECVLKAVSANKMTEYARMKNTIIATNFKGKPIKPRTFNQLALYDSVNTNDITFAIGCAGTGKSLVAVAMGVKQLLDKKVDKLILTRPAIEAGESIGFIPGGITEKLSPYLKPLYSYLDLIVGKEKADLLLLTEKIEINSIGFMRGTNYENSFVIVDEAQNTKPEQMKMILTRLSTGSKMLIIGDTTQTDLRNKNKNGLVSAENILKGISGIGFCYLGDEDVIRHPLVQKIVKAYNSYEEKLQTPQLLNE